jgi:hypothetical protein
MQIRNVVENNVKTEHILNKSFRPHPSNMYGICAEDQADIKSSKC